MRRTFRLLAFLPLLLLAAVPVVAQDAGPEAAEPAPPWVSSLGLAFLSTSGNSDTSTFGLDLTAKREPAPWGFDIGASYYRAEDSGATTAERYKARARAERALNDRWSVLAGLSGEKDEFAGFDLRGIVETGARYRALRGPTHSLSFDGGLTWTTEDSVAGESEDYLGGFLGLDWLYQITETAALTQRLLYYPSFETSSDWRATSETALTANISTAFALKLGYLVRYDHQPVEGFDDTDTTTTVSLVLSF